MTIDLFQPIRRLSAYRSRRDASEAAVLRRAWTPLVLAITLGICLEAHGKPPSSGGASKRGDVPRLAFGDFFDVSAQELKPSARLLEFAGRRVKLAGFMAKMEVAPKGAFYLTPRPVSCDEEGGGTADLPPEAVYVTVRSSVGQEIPYTPRALEVTGLLEVGYHVEPDDRVTHIRLLLDRPQDLLGSAPKHQHSPNPPEVRP
ncbi:MAG: hypothetical protein HXX12_04875 [Geothrix sp.]|uniref:hypothetical protein n=1 Tax=Geothrix sp. TaxID=1962974 RepID=UPI001809245C|nr:hypothetical protein [Geothrix sp.]NWJ40289.1 hypothetical protein [Geothrix sp.]WIL21706.1 MAG: hypothetical protein QOZ81_000976 [Geothrix sp.]